MLIVDSFYAAQSGNRLEPVGEKLRLK